MTEVPDVDYNLTLTYRRAGKFDGELNLAVEVETAKLKSTNITALVLCDRSRMTMR